MLEKFENWSNEPINEATSLKDTIQKNLVGLKKDLEKTKNSFIEFIDKMENLHWNSKSEEEKKKLNILLQDIKGNVYFSFKETLKDLNNFEHEL